MTSGAIAQLGERLLCKQEVVGSIPSGSTSGVCDRLLVRKKNENSPCKALRSRSRRMRVLSDIVKRRSFRANVKRRYAVDRFARYSYILIRGR